MSTGKQMERGEGVREQREVEGRRRNGTETGLKVKSERSYRKRR